VIFVGPQQVRLGVILLVIFSIGIGLLSNYQRLLRQYIGVKSGVKLEGQMIEGLLPQEVTEIVERMSEKINHAPRNAVYFSETGEVIPAKSGQRVNVSQSVKLICAAEPGTDLKLVVEKIPPRVPTSYFQAVYEGDKSLSKVGLAINVAWGEEHLPMILETLKREKVKATFFLVGAWVKQFPELVKQMADEGHELANHGLYHGHPLQMGKGDLQKLIAENALLIHSLTKCKSVNLFGPPYGEVNQEVVNSAAALGYRTIMWTVDSVDWKNPDPGIMLTRIMKKIESGGIVLLHPTMPTKKVLGQMIHELRQKGLEPGKVSLMLSNN